MSKTTIPVSLKTHQQIKTEAAKRGLKIKDLSEAIAKDGLKRFKSGDLAISKEVKP